MKKENMVFIFPSDYYKNNEADEMFKDQAEVFSKFGFECIFIDINQIEDGLKLPTDLLGKTVLYRGWMLTKDGYAKFCKVVESANGKMFIPLEEYLLAHYLPNWYPLIRKDTIQTVLLDRSLDLKMQLLSLGWDGYFIKDYVKSLKTSIGSIIHDANQIDIVVSEIEKFRGIIEGGICVRKVEDFLIETEKRFFVINGKPYSSHANQLVPDIILRCAKEIKHKFYSVDLVKRRDGQEMIVEIGDGQVSDYVGWELNRFVEVLSRELS